MATEETITEYRCSECGATVTSEGTEASDHMRDEHGADPEAGPEAGPQPDSPYLIPAESNPTDLPGPLTGADLSI